MSISKVVLLHGKPKVDNLRKPGYDPGRAHFLGYAADRLEAMGLEAIVLRPGMPAKPDYHVWKREINAYAHRFDEGTLVLTHSLGMSAMMRFLGNSSIELGGLVGVAPWMGRRPQDGSFSKFKIDPEIAERVGKTVIVKASDDKSGGVPETTKEIVSELPGAEVVELGDGFGHFTDGNPKMKPYDMGGRGIMGVEFPELIGFIEERFDLAS